MPEPTPPQHPVTPPSQASAGVPGLPPTVSGGPASPFPGMDPYLENPTDWPDFHREFVGNLRAALNAQLPADYQARLEERFQYIEVAPSETAESAAGAADNPDADPRTVAEGQVDSGDGNSVVIPVPGFRETKLAYIAIMRGPHRELVTVIEVLSPPDKTGDGRIEYLAKRNALYRQPIHLLDIDLLVSGQRLPLGTKVPALQYSVVLARADRRPTAQVYPFTVRQPFPVIRVPLGSGDADIPLELGTAFAESYRRGRYHLAVNYGRTPATAAAFAEAERTWVLQTARMAANRRGSLRRPLAETASIAKPAD